MSKHALAEQTGVHLCQVRNLERGAVVAPAVVAAIARALNLPIAQLLAADFAPGEVSLLGLSAEHRAIESCGLPL